MSKRNVITSFLLSLLISTLSTFLSLYHLTSAPFEQYTQQSPRHDISVSGDKKKTLRQAKTNDYANDGGSVSGGVLSIENGNTTSPTVATFSGSRTEKHTIENDTHWSNMTAKPRWLSEMLNKILENYTYGNASPNNHSHSSYSTVPVMQPRPWQQAALPTSSATIVEEDPRDDDNGGGCALLFFGLPRSFRELVLPSVIQYILLPNARHNCDVYVHYYDLERELPGRFNYGGRIKSQDVLDLEYATHAVWEWYHQTQQQQQQENQRHPNPPQQKEKAAQSSAHRRRTISEMTTPDLNRRPIVRFTKETEEDFWRQRGSQIERYLTTTIPRPNNNATKQQKRKQQLLYFPYRAKNWETITLINLVKQWHSIDKVFTFMDQEMGTKYSRVAMFRSDCVYLTPIDIAVMGQNNNNPEDDDEVVVDTRNQHAIIPAFARWPVNDRMIYGPYPAVRIWATERFRLVEERAIQNDDPGWVMHSERFCNSTLFPAMERDAAARATVVVEATSSAHQVERFMGNHSIPDYQLRKMTPSSSSMIRWNHDICFVRARADTSVMASDCSGGKEGSTRQWTTNRSLDVLEQTIVGRKCIYYEVIDSAGWIFAGCRPDQEWYAAKNASGEIKLIQNV